MEKNNFIEEIIINDLKNNKVTTIQTRFPPEPNGYLHLGHLKSIFTNFTIKEKFNGKCNLFLDDTNPLKESQHYVDKIKENLSWLGYHYDKLVFASDFFSEIYNYALTLIKSGKAYVCDLSAEEISATRGTFTTPGKESPYRDRSIEENLKLFEEMCNGIYPEGTKCLRAKIDMSSPNLNLRDPVIYRILFRDHYRTGNKWCIYPNYDYAHPICDYLQGVTHSICTLEFEDHRPLYDWVGINLNFNPKPRQIEFARLELTYCLMSKRYLKKLVEAKIVDGWDDPRLPTLSGLQKRGIPVAALKLFCEKIGLTKANSQVDWSYFMTVIRDYLYPRAPVAFAVLNPLKVEIINYEGEDETLTWTNNLGEEISLKFGRFLYLSSEDFQEQATPDFYRLTLNGVVRLKGAYIIKCEAIERNNYGEITSLKCSYFKNSLSGKDCSKIKVKSTIQWVGEDNSLSCRLIRYDLLFNDPNPTPENFSSVINKESKKDIPGKINRNFLNVHNELNIYQLLRIGYFKLLALNGEEAILSEVVALKNKYSTKN